MRAMGLRQLSELLLELADYKMMVYHSYLISPKYRVVMMSTDEFPDGSANFAATSLDPNFSLVW